MKTIKVLVTCTVDDVLYKAVLDDINYHIDLVTKDKTKFITELLNKYKLSINHSKEEKDIKRLESRQEDILKILTKISKRLEI